MPVTLEIDGRAVDTTNVTIGPNASGVGDVRAGHRRRSRTCAASIRAGSDALPKDNDFYFVLSPSRPVSVLVVNGDGADRDVESVS